MLAIAQGIFLFQQVSWPVKSSKHMGHTTHGNIFQKKAGARTPEHCGLPLYGSFIN
jgi:hypothetical protein